MLKNAEAIAGYKPDLVIIGNGGADPAATARLREDLRRERLEGVGDQVALVLADGVHADGRRVPVFREGEQVVSQPTQADRTSSTRSARRRKSRRTTVPKQQQAPVATSTSQQRKITQALEKVIAAINQADLSEKEKNEAKSSLRKLLSSKAAAKVLGAGAQSLSTKYFTG